MKTRNFLLFLCCVLLPAVGLANVGIEGIRLWTAPDHTRLVFDVSNSTEHKLFRLHNPERLVIDFEKTSLRKALDPRKFQNRHLSGIRHAKKDQQDLRIVLDLKKPVRPKSFLLKPNKQYGHRLVIDIYDQLGSQTVPKVTKTTQNIKQHRDVIVAVDAGHGGDDPGAIGSRLKAQEKKITLAIARKLKKLIDAEPGMRAVLTRTGDYYVGLRNRMKIARRHHADLFVSIHADAFRNKKAKGSSVFVLSRRGASSEAARWLAARENSADLVGGVSLDDKDGVLASVLLDLSQSATQQVSLSAARRVHKEMARIGKLHGDNVQQAGFMVLKSPDIPSMLIETGFISNPTEERNLASSRHQDKIARAVLKGVKGYFNSEPPPGTWLAQQRHQNRDSRYTIQAGDTLSDIALRYQVSLASLRQENRIKNDRIRIGQVLRIPKT